MTHPYRRLANIALLTANLALAGLVFLQFRGGFDELPAEAAPVAPAAPGALPAATAATQDHVDRASLIADILARPVFSPGRRPDPAAAAAAHSPAAFRLVGVVLSGTRRFALVQMADEPRPRHVAEGEHIGDYRIVAISADRIRARGSDGERDVPLQPAAAANRTSVPARPQPTASRPVPPSGSGD